MTQLPIGPAFDASNSAVEMTLLFTQSNLDKVLKPLRASRQHLELLTIPWSPHSPSETVEHHPLSLPLPLPLLLDITTRQEADAMANSNPTEDKGSGKTQDKTQETIRSESEKAEKKTSGAVPDDAPPRTKSPSTDSPRKDSPHTKSPREESGELQDKTGETSNGVAAHTEPGQTRTQTPDIASVVTVPFPRNVALYPSAARSATQLPSMPEPRNVLPISDEVATLLHLRSSPALEALACHYLGSIAAEMKDASKDLLVQHAVATFMDANGPRIWPRLDGERRHLTDGSAGRWDLNNDGGVVTDDKPVFALHGYIQKERWEAFRQTYGRPPTFHEGVMCSRIAAILGPYFSRLLETHRSALLTAAGVHWTVNQLLAQSRWSAR